MKNKSVEELMSATLGQGVNCSEIVRIERNTKIKQLPAFLSTGVQKFLNCIIWSMENSESINQFVFYNLYENVVSPGKFVFIEAGHAKALNSHFARSSHQICRANNGSSGKRVDGTDFLISNGSKKVRINVVVHGINFHLLTWVNDQGEISS